VALTGGIATGKSHVLAGMQARGVPCLDADELAHGVMAAGTEATSAIADRFGDILTPSGEVDRRRLGAIVFADPSARRDLEAIVHPAVYRAIEAGLRAFAQVGDAPFAIVDIPLLYETGRARDFAKVVATVCSPAHQLVRLRERGLSAEAAVQRLDAQLPAEEKARRADYVIRTDGAFSETDRQIDEVLAALSQAAAADDRKT
jgi:dephospho-CoA kinase